MSAPDLRRIIAVRLQGCRRFGALGVALAIATVCNCQDSARPKTNDEKAQELILLENKTHTFQDFLSGNPEAIANEKQIFALTSDSEIKRRIAGILISIGIKDQVYLDYLTAEARRALRDETPWPTLYDEHGRRNERADHPEFVAWCKKHGLNPNDERYAAYRAVNPAFMEWCDNKNLNPQNERYAAYYETPVLWYDLAAARDPRAYDLLIEGLHSHNLMIAGVAAKGLARLQDPRAIDELIATGRRAHGEARGAVAQSLLYFPDPKAQAAADELADLWTDKKVWEMLREQARTKGVKALFPY